MVEQQLLSALLTENLEGVLGPTNMSEGPEDPLVAGYEKYLQGEIAAAADETERAGLEKELKTFREAKKAAKKAAAVRQKESSKAALLGQGGYGCAFKPPLPCYADMHLPEKHGKTGPLVGKVFKAGREGDFAMEYQMLARLQELDPEGEFHVPAVGDCTVRFDRKDAIGTSCNAKAGTPQLLLQDGGVPSALWAAKQSKEAVAKAFRPLFLGLEKLSAAGLLHFDAKPENILVSNGKLRYIDLGLLEEWSGVLSKPRTTPNYFMYPPEFDYMRHLLSGTKGAYKAENMKLELQQLESRKLKGGSIF